MHCLLALVLAQSAIECDSGDACREAARVETNAARAKEFRQRAVALEALKRGARRARAVKLAPSVPPLVEAVDEEELPATQPAPAEEPSVPPPTLDREVVPVEPPSVPPVVSAPPAVAPEEVAAQPTPGVEVREEVKDPGPPTQVGFTVIGGLETGPPLGSDTWEVRGRAGLGARFALTRRDPQTREVEAVPAASLLVGYAGRLVDPNDHRVFGELRLELLAARPRGMLGPAFTAYLLSGVDVLVGDPGVGAQPYVGAGVGWDVNPFSAPQGRQPSPNAAKPTAGLGVPMNALNLGSSGGAMAAVLVPLAMAAVVGAVIAFVCAGRIEVRYSPGSSRGAPSLSILVGYGF